MYDKTIFPFQIIILPMFCKKCKAADISDTRSDKSLSLVDAQWTGSGYISNHYTKTKMRRQADYKIIFSSFKKLINITLT